jgi:hypothetical protein
MTKMSEMMVQEDQRLMMSNMVNDHEEDSNEKNDGSDIDSSNQYHCQRQLPMDYCTTTPPYCR